MPSLTRAALQNLQLPLSELISGRIGFIHDLFLTFPYEFTKSLPAGDRDLVVLIGKKNRGARIQELGSYPGRVVLVCAPGDAPIRGHFMPEGRGLPSNVVAAYVTNNQLADRRAVTVPLGVRVGNLRALQFVRQNKTRKSEGLLYGNFTVNDEHYQPDRSGLPHVRARLADALKAEPWATLDVNDERRESPEELVRYFAQIAAHRFVLSPEGNGIDCYRTWEILYLGAIPIVMMSPTMSSFTQLPMLFTEDYSELSQQYLMRRWEEMSRRTFDIDRMLKSFYFRRFLVSVASLEDPLFLCWEADDFPSPKFARSLQRSSRSASGVLAETPTPPFTGRQSLLKADDWRTSGGLRVKQADTALEVILGEDGGEGRFNLQTISGGPFRLTGMISPSDSNAVLTVSARGRSEPIVAFEVAGETALDLPFVADSDRTVLTIEAQGATPEAVWRVRDLRVRACL